MNGYENIFRRKVIYVYAIPAETHKGLLKIGETSVDAGENLPPNSPALNAAATKRIKQQTSAAGLTFNLLHTELAVTDNRQTFGDKAVHSVLIRSGFKPNPPHGSNAREWFKIDLKTALDAIAAVKHGKKSIANSTTDFIPITFRPEQKDAINSTVKTFKKNSRMLWNAKMRFGKTLCALEVVRRLNFHKTIIITHRPVVNQNWFSDFAKIFHDNPNFSYGSKSGGESFANLLTSNKNFVYFASIQDLRGSEVTGGKFSKNAEIFSTNWDCVIVDEAHEGTTTALGDSVINALVKPNSKLLALSGTPFNIIDDYDANVFTWDYIDEQRAKSNWATDDSNPYAELPKLQIFTYNLGKILNQNFLDPDNFFNFKEFFRTSNKNFVHANAVNQFLNLLTSPNSNYPFSNDAYRNIFRHTLWIIPGVKEGRALSKILKAHPIFSNFKIVNVAGNGDSDDEPNDALQKVQAAIKNFNYTITLSCGKLTSGVTVPQWSAVLMLAGGYSTSAANYLQTIFRVQNSYSANGYFKSACYVFDFAPDRTLKVIAESVAATGGSRQRLQEFLNFCPVIAADGSSMSEFNSAQLFQELKRAKAQRAVRHGFDDSGLYNENLLNLTKSEIDNFNKLQKIIGSSKSQKKSQEVILNDTGLKRSKNSAAPPDSTKKIRRAAISILRGISIRMPLIIYGADIPLDQDFSLDMFCQIVDDNSWREFMPKGVTKDFFRDFIKYYDPDVFIAAGREIRQRTKAADNLPPTERVIQIAKIFATFKNPDKETVLTPFNVVNLHLSLALGGFDFFDDNHQNISNPHFVRRQNFNFDTNAHILEINSKSGLYPLYLAYSLYRKRLGSVPESKFKLHTLQHLWDVTLAENIFVICKTPMARAITIRTLAGFRRAPCNARYFPNLLANSDFFISQISSNSFWNKGDGSMFFDAVVGNPPYQVAQLGDNDNFATPIYHKFLELTFKLNTKVSLIHPARFLFNAGATAKDFNFTFLHNKHVKILYYNPKSWELFPNTDIKGGVAISYFDPNEDFGEIGIFIPFDDLISIHRKVIGRDDFSPISKIMRGQETFKLSRKAYEDFPDLPKRLPKRTDTALRTNALEKMPDIFLEEKPDDGAEYFQIIGKLNDERVYRFVRRDYMIDIPEFYTYKVFIPAANGSGMIGERLSTPLVGLPLVGLPLVGCTQTFITLGAFATRTEADNALKYVKTKFARALLGVLKVTQHNPPATWACVPNQDFSGSSDIDWSRSIHALDLQLYRKYNLSPQEILFIEEKVRVME